jgi:NAD(P)-dependent dehydrogenase (short-subunit alcohol dehydrogenase family)
VSSKDRADQVADKCKEFGVKTAVVQAVRMHHRLLKPSCLLSDGVPQDIGVVEDTIRLVKESVEQLGGLDIIINNAGWTRFANFGDLNDLSHDEWNKVGV